MKQLAMVIEGINTTLTGKREIMAKAGDVDIIFGKDLIRVYADDLREFNALSIEPDLQLLALAKTSGYLMAYKLNDIKAFNATDLLDAVRAAICNCRPGDNTFNLECSGMVDVTITLIRNISQKDFNELKARVNIGAHNYRMEKSSYTNIGKLILKYDGVALYLINNYVSNGANTVTAMATVFTKGCDYIKEEGYSEDMQKALASALDAKILSLLPEIGSVK